MKGNFNLCLLLPSRRPKRVASWTVAKYNGLPWTSSLTPEDEVLFYNYMINDNVYVTWQWTFHVYLKRRNNPRNYEFKLFHIFTWKIIYFWHKYFNYFNIYIYDLKEIISFIVKRIKIFLLKYDKKNIYIYIEGFLKFCHF